jgi:hypothetical protein
LNAKADAVAEIEKATEQAEHHLERFTHLSRHLADLGCVESARVMRSLVDISHEHILLLRLRRRQLLKDVRDPPEPSPILAESAA